jgi:hypothetical protein
VTPHNGSQEEKEEEINRIDTQAGGFDSPPAFFPLFIFQK